MGFAFAQQANHEYQLNCLLGHGRAGKAGWVIQISKQQIHGQ